MMRGIDRLIFVFAGTASFIILSLFGVSTVATSLSGNEQEAVQRNQATYELYVE
jgi:hypothetical protein